MALIMGGLERLKIKYPNFDLGKTKIIGWGAGQWFRDYFPILNIPISYTICPIAENHGARIHGIEVKSPSILFEESPDDLFILIIAAHRNEITNQIRSFGQFKCVHAFDFDVDSGSIYDDLLDISKLNNKIIYTPLAINMHDEKINKRIAIFHTGPLPDYAELALKYNRLRHPQYYQVLITWKGESAENIEACSKWVDELILIAAPVRPGVSNINFMLRSNRYAIKFLLGHNFEYAIRLRTGNILIGNINKFLANNLIEFELGAKKFGFYCNWSWKNIPFHISDAFMFGSTKDLYTLWSVDEDHREDFIDEIVTPRFLSDLLSKTSETYLWGNYANKLGYDLSSLEDYYKFLVNELLPLEPILNTLSLKHIPAYTIDYDSTLSPTPSWWRKLNENRSAELKKGLARYSANSTIKDYWQGKIG